MHRCEKLSFEAITDFNELPKLKLHTVDCPRCHWRQPVPVEYIDWREVSETYERAYKSMSKSFMALMAEAGEQFDAPLVEYALANRQVFIAEMKNLLERMKEANEEGEEWKQP